MNILATLIFVVVVLVVGTRLNQDNKDVQTEFQEVQGASLEPEEETDDASSPLPTSTPTLPKSTLSPSAPNPEITVINEYLYPGSVIVNSDGGSMKLTSSDDPDMITQWYKEKIKSAGMNVNSFVTTKTNDNVLNKLSGADGKTEIKIEIKKQVNDSKVEISVIKQVN